MHSFFNRGNIIRILILALAAVFACLLLFRVSLPLINKVLGSPDLSILENYQPIGSIQIYDYRDNFVGVLQGEEDRQVIKLDQMSDYIIQAVLASEDSDFFDHGGFSLLSITRAFFANLKAGKIVQGGSTISQQMVKNLFIKEDDRYKRTIVRKIRELLIAFEVESKYPKEKILEIYLNQVYFGRLAYGVERASQRYFSKPSKQLSIAQAAYLAGLLTAPSYLSKNLDKALERQKYVLGEMVKNGYINEEEYKKASAEKLQFNYAQGNLSKFPFYFSYIESELSKRFTRHELESLGLKVYTALDPIAQRLAEQKLSLGVKNAAYGINQGALVTIDVESAQVRALVGGVGNFWQNQFNRATNIHTLGSAFKPFVYLTALMQGIVDPSSSIKDEELKIPDISSPTGFWTPQNFDKEFHGPITIRAALVFSRNIPAVKIAMRTGIKNIMQTAEKAGIKTKMQPLLSLALGAQAFSPLEVASAYSTFARGGVQVEPVIIRKITDTKGRVLEVNKPVGKANLPAHHVAQLVNILEDVTKHGTGTLAKIPRPMAGKTGTADGSRDIWFVGFTPDYVTAVWCGNELNKQVYSRYATGGSTPAWIWREYMSSFYAAKPRPPRSFSFTPQYRLVAIDPITGSRANDYTPNPVFKRFLPGAEPYDASPIPQVSKIKARGRQRFFGFRKKLSKEDKELKSASKIEKRKKKKDQDEGESEQERSSPKPKHFTIETNPQDE